MWTHTNSLESRSARASVKVGAGVIPASRELNHELAHQVLHVKTQPSALI